MSDEPSKEPRPVAPPGIWEHYCEHPGCTKWGGWGYANGRTTNWYCGEHKPAEISPAP